ncbi:FAD dependent oxidoreductase [Aulographum hederae CBS 113979]|uniref:FAD dependent oxidoreductase n=1 Tax=Aulographum hederae CBS 113979 TaxID=1176131 RepID=A0A6G1H6V3_9PEZI|nr:FAD dependent oxidoreductase [Aulographum hederae CBS 113979]
MGSFDPPESQNSRAGLPVADSSKSFWHSEPSEKLLGHRTTPDLPSEADIVIVGSGITGASAARFLAEDERAKGKRIVLLEAREACWGATGRNGGHCQPLLFDRSPDVASFELRNYNAVKSYIKEHNVACEWRELPGCRTFWTSALMKSAIVDVEALRNQAPKLGEMVEIITEDAQLKEHRVVGAPGATITQGCASVWPYKLIAHILEKLLSEERLNLQTNTSVTKLESKSDDKIAVHTDRGIITAPTVILATNGYTSHLLPDFSDLIVPVRGEMSALLPPSGSSRLSNSYGFVGAKGGNPNHDDYLVQRPFSDVPNPAGHLMFGGGRTAAKLSSIGETDDSVVDKGSARYLRETLLEVLDLGGNAEELKELEATHQWTGIMGYSKDNHPWVGKVPGMSGVWLAGGYTGHGMPNGTLCGKAVVDMVLAEAEGEDLKALHSRMVEEGDLPQAYLITSQRFEKAKNLPTVAAQDGDEAALDIRSFNLGVCGR